MSLEMRMEAKVVAWFGAITQAMMRSTCATHMESRELEVDVLVELALGLIPDRLSVEADLGQERFLKLRGMLSEWSRSFKAGESDGKQPGRIFEMLTGKSLAASC